MVSSSKQKPTQRVCEECVERLEQLGLFGRKVSFDDTLHTLLDFCEQNKKEFEKWKKKKILK